MRSDTFVGNDLRNVFDLARGAMGEEIVILRTNITGSAATRRVELTVAPAVEVDMLRDQVSPPPFDVRHAGGGNGPLVIAVVGPTGAGKTTTAAKLALSPRAFGGKRVGLLTLDSFRIGATEQMIQIAELAGLPLVIAREFSDVAPAMARLASCDVVIVDTAGRGPRSREINARAKAMLRATRPDEIHFVVPATMRPELAVILRDRYADAAPTFSLVTKTDELADSRAVLDLILALEMPSRWVGDGQEIARDLQDAGGQLSMSSPFGYRVEVAS